MGLPSKKFGPALSGAGSILTIGEFETEFENILGC
jgi:hypothetical protein